VKGERYKVKGKKYLPFTFHPLPEKAFFDIFGLYGFPIRKKFSCSTYFENSFIFPMFAQ